MSVFNRPGLYFRNPGGGVEDIANMKAHGFETIAVKIRDYTVPEWSFIRQKAAQQGVPCIPWARCLSNNEVTALCIVARDWGTAVLVNCENELQDGRVDAAHIIKETKGMDAACSTLCWTGMDIKTLGAIPIHLQLFPQETDASTRPRDCRARTCVEGGKHVTFMVGMHDTVPAAFPALQSPYWVYTADDCANDFETWGPKTFASLNIPFRGALYPVGHPKHVSRKKPWTIRALKVAVHRAGFENFPQEVPDPGFGPRLANAIRCLQKVFGLRPTGYYGSGVHAVLQTLQATDPGAGYALTPEAQKWLSLP